uniref:DUF6531 domain-containing protein n=1 Tax=Geobacter sp. TaxID=46610 RepID=UPI0026396CC5
MARTLLSPKISILCYLLLLVLLSIALPAWGATTNVANGGFYHNQELFSTKGTPQSLDMSLFYNSMYSYQGSLSQGWTHSYDISLTDGGNGSKVLHDGDNIRLYLANGTSFTSQTGDTSVLTLNGTGFLITYRDGRKGSFGADGRITSLVDRYGNTVNFAYTGGDLTAITDPAGRSVILEYDTTVTPHRIKGICPTGVATTDDATRKYTFEYDPASGLLAKITNPLADASASARGYWEYSYDPQSKLLKTILDPNGKLFTYNYYPDGRMQSAVDPDGAPDANGVATVAGHTRTLVYDNEAGTIKTTTFIEKDGGVWTYVYDTHAGVLKQKIAPDPATGAAGGASTSYAYYADGSLKAKTEPSGIGKRLTTFYQYDGFGNVASETEPVDLSVYTNPTVDPETVDVATLATLNPSIKWAFQYTYDNFDRLLTKTDLRGATPLVTTYTFDTTSEPGVEIMKVTDPENKLFTYRYNSAGGTLKSVIDANNVSVTYDYYPNGLLLSAKDQNGVVTKVTLYDNNGNPREIQKLDKTGKLLVTTTLEYDALNRLRTVTRTTTDTPPIVTASKYDYDLAGNLTVYTDPEDQPAVRQTKYEYNYNGQVTKIIDADQKETRLTYGGTGCSSCGGGVGKLTEVKD